MRSVLKSVLWTIFGPALNWLFPNGIQGERGGWKDDDSHEPPPQARER